MIYVFLADGFEEIEAIAPIDLLRRSGLEVAAVGVGGETVRSSHGVVVTADITDKGVKLDDKLKMIVLPGGMPGTLNLEKSAAVQKAVDYCAENGVFIGAICAAPSILGHKGLLNGREAVCYKGWEEHLQGALIQDAETVRDDNIITARGAGVSFEFGLALVEALLGGEQADELREVTMCAKRRS